MKRINDIITNKQYIGIDFVVHIQKKSELQDLIYILNKNQFISEFNLNGESLENWANRLGEEFNYNLCFRIRNRENKKSVVGNASIEYWLEYYKYILEISDDKLVMLKKDDKIIATT